MDFITYPTRPINGGKLERAPEKIGSWVADAKVNGHRIMVHLPTLRCWNRQGEPFSMSDEYSEALHELQRLLPGAEWVDCEGLLRRHQIGKGSLVVLDVMTREPIKERRASIVHIKLLPINKDEVEENTVYLVPQVPWSEVKDFYEALRDNKPLYEGVVAKSLDFPEYNLQTISPTREFHAWQKHRFIG